MPSRSYTSATAYRYGFNGKENDNEVKGNGNQQDYGMRIYDPRLGKFLSVDPLTDEYPFLTPYAFAENDVIRSIDLDGLEKVFSNGGQQLTNDQAKNVFGSTFDENNNDIYSVSYYNESGDGYKMVEFGGLQNLGIKYDDFMRLSGLSYAESGFSDDVSNGIPFAVVNHHQQLRNSGLAKYGTSWTIAQTIQKMRVYSDDEYANGNAWAKNGNPAFRNFLGIKQNDPIDFTKNVKGRNSDMKMRNAIKYSIDALKYLNNTQTSITDYSQGGIGWQGVDIFSNTNWQNWLFVNTDDKKFGFRNWVNKPVLEKATFESTVTFTGPAGTTLFYKSTPKAKADSKTGGL